MQSFSFRLPREEEEKLLSSHEYVRDTKDFYLSLSKDRNKNSQTEVTKT